MAIHNTQRAAFRSYLFGFLTILISWSVYLFYICPSIYWRDSAEFITAGYTLSVPHPAGSPAYSLIAKLFTFIPAGSIAFRVNLVSAVFGCFSVYLLYRVVRALILNLWPGENVRTADYSSFVSAMLFLFSATFWRFSEVAEVYTQQIFWLLLIILLLLKASEAEEERSKYLTIAALLYGLSMGTHAVMGFYLPAILLYIFLMDRSRLMEARKLFPLMFFLFLGLAVYMYVPVRSAANPWLDWGNPQTAKKLLYHLIDKKDVSTHFTIIVHNFSFQLRNYASMLPKQLSYFGLFLTTIGFAVTLRKKRIWWLLFLIFFIHFAFFIRTWRADFGFMPTFTIMAIWAGIGLHYLVTLLNRKFSEVKNKVAGTGFVAGRPSRPAILLYVLMGVLVVFMATINRPYADKSRYYSTYRFGKYLLNSLDYKGVLLDQFAWFQSLYLQGVENARPDVSSILRNAFAFPEVFFPVDNKRFPLLHIPDRAREKSPYDFMMDTIESNINRLPIYWYQVDKLAPLKRMTPKGIVFQILPQGTEPKWGDMKEHVDKLYRFMEREFDDPYFWKDEEGRKVYSLNLTGLAMYFLEHKRVRHAELMQRLAFQVDPESSSVLNNYGVLYEYMDKLKEAEDMYRKGVEVEPGDPSIRANLGVVLYKQEEDQAALKEFNRVLKAAPYNQTANYHLGLMAIEHGDIGEFTRRLAMTIRDGPNSKLGRKARELLRKYRRGELELPSGVR